MKLCENKATIYLSIPKDLKLSQTASFITPMMMMPRPLSFLILRAISFLSASNLIQAYQIKNFSQNLLYDDTCPQVYGACQNKVVSYLCYKH